MAAIIISARTPFLGFADKCGFLNYSTLRTILGLSNELQCVQYILAFNSKFLFTYYILSKLPNANEKNQPSHCNFLKMDCPYKKKYRKLYMKYQLWISYSFKITPSLKIVLFYNFSTAISVGDKKKTIQHIKDLYGIKH